MLNILREDIVLLSAAKRLTVATSYPWESANSNAYSRMKRFSSAQKRPSCAVASTTSAAFICASTFSLRRKRYAPYRFMCRYSPLR